MPYLVDGHNLIPKAGLRLDAPDDEMELVRRLQEFCRLHRKQVEVYFDGAPAGQAGTRNLGAVKAIFVLGESLAELDGGQFRPPGAGRSARRPRGGAFLRGVCPSVTTKREISFLVH